VLADTFEGIPIENIAVFIDPERRIIYPVTFSSGLASVWPTAAAIPPG